MAQSVGFTQRPELRQSQKLAPQMQQSLQILQVPTLELRSLIQNELAENPALEDDTVEISLEEQGLDRDQESGDEDFDKEFSELSKMDDDWRDYLSQSSRAMPRTAEDEEKYQFRMDSLVRPVTLQEHLLEQLNVEGSEPRVHDLAEMLIGNLDENGFLQIDIEELSLANGIPIGELRIAQQLLRSFDPPGVGATDLAECLSIQLERLGKKTSLEHRIVSGHLDDLAKKRYPLIARKLSVTTEQISAAAESISNLNPKPGRSFGAGDNRFVTPDVFVEKDEHGEYKITLDNEQIPRLRISNAFKDLMAEQGSRPEVRAYIKEKIRSGKTLISSIQQRQDTIRRIVEEIIKRQRDFLEQGRAHLHPMNMAQVAEVVGVHETTVSRAVSGKYISTPQGVFEIKFFFTTGYQTESGESVANTSVKDTIAEIVAEEDHHKPLSDQQIVAELAERGIKIARRTAAKYREALEILPSHMRKTF
ncbi:MAG: RNA polymerase sigma-54 factor [Verrucomicrobiales bacterium]|jgi:RNA polymerase sigma-54 factor